MIVTTDDINDRCDRNNDCYCKMDDCYSNRKLVHAARHGNNGHYRGNDPAEFREFLCDIRAALGEHPDDIRADFLSDLADNNLCPEPMQNLRLTVKIRRRPSSKQAV